MEASAPPAAETPDSPTPPAAEAAATPSKDDFYSDPLITEALRLFHGKLQE